MCVGQPVLRRTVCPSSANEIHHAELSANANPKNALRRSAALPLTSCSSTATTGADGADWLIAGPGRPEAEGAHRSARRDGAITESEFIERLIISAAFLVAAYFSLGYRISRHWRSERSQ